MFATDVLVVGFSVFRSFCFGILDLGRVCFLDFGDFGNGDL